MHWRFSQSKLGPIFSSGMAEGFQKSMSTQPVLKSVQAVQKETPPIRDEQIRSPDSYAKKKKKVIRSFPFMFFVK